MRGIAARLGVVGDGESVAVDWMAVKRPPQCAPLPVAMAHAAGLGVALQLRVSLLRPWRRL